MHFIVKKNRKHIEENYFMEKNFFFLCTRFHCTPENLECSTKKKRESSEAA